MAVRRGGHRREGVFFARKINPHAAAGGDVSLEDFRGQGVLEPLLDDPLEWASAVERVVPFVGDCLSGGIGNHQADFLLIELLPQALELQVHDAGNLLLGQRLEDDDLVDAVEKLRQEFFLECFLHRHLDLLHRSPLARDFLDHLAADVAGHHHNGVREVHGMAMVIGQAAVIQHLQQDVEHVAVGFLDFIEQHHGVGTAADRFRQLAPFLVADIARRSPNQAADGVLLHELAHVDADHRVFVVEHDFRERLAKLRFPHAGRPQKNERADRPIGILQAAAAASDGARHGGHGLVLPHHSLVQPLFHDE